ncbi:MAG: Eco57I restriction-modification methylase domain-containing protein [Prevotellaceae bacterium]|nr:Eco57I restriction-modification methylase domain-containing protein [Prevotellaceae bacterium]
MNNDIDAAWFNRRDVFNIEDNWSWHTNQELITFPKRKGSGWHAYVESPRLEITCGEAPFVCSRYDTVTGETLPVERRIGFLDRKLRVVSEKTKTRKEWVRWALAALKSSYGFEYQGDNLLLARINVFETFCEHLYERWVMGITDDELDQAAWIVSWNFWQMNGFTCAVPTNKMDAIAQSTLFGFEEPVPEPLQPTLFDLLDESSFDKSTQEEKEEESGETVPFCIIYDWQENEPFEFQVMKGKAYPMDKKFYAVIGNPPYQEELEGNQRNPPIYNLFMDEAYKISSKVELITPARFLSDAGQTPKEWNRKMLQDPHLKVMEFEPDASTVFSGVEIKGGVVVTYRDEESNFGAIETFVPYEPLRSALFKVQATSTDTLSGMVTGAVPYKFTDKARKDHPEYVELMGKSCDLRTNALDNLYDKLFFRNKRDDLEYAAIYGLFKKKRECLWIERQYIDVPENFSGYKVLLSKANGAGTYGEKLSSFEIAAKGVGHTQSFISIGNFETEAEAKNLVKYLESKFARSLLGILKVTQDISPRVWSLVPVQDFTDDSDIAWWKSINEIDKQLYAKYGFTNEEIDFIESHVKEMN